MATVDEISAAYDANTQKNAAPAASYGDTGGAAGSASGTLNSGGKVGTPLNTNANTTTNISSPAYSTARTDAINQMYDSRAAARRQELEAAYNRQMSSAQAAAEKIPQTYQQQANDLAVQYERNRRNMNLQADANGLNTGTGSQMALALNSQWQRDYGGVKQAQANAQAEADRGMADLTAQYESNIQSALAQNDYQKAAALLDEYNNAESRNLKNAQIMAQFGDFSGFASLYGQDQADNMLAIWRAQNPDLALMTGSITQAQHDNLVNGRPMNDGLDANGNRIAAVGGGNVGSPYLDAYYAMISNPGYSNTPSENQASYDVGYRTLGW